MASKFVITSSDKNAICDSMIQRKIKKIKIMIFFGMMTWCVTSHHINLGLYIYVS
jgi:hypothetical protein